MSNINLLPWRESDKKNKKVAFFTLLGMCCLVTLMLCYTGKLYVDSIITAQNVRNQFLQTQTIILDQRISEIAHIKQQKAELVRRINLIQKLDQQRNMITHLFNTLPAVTPAGVYIDSLTFKDLRVDVKGLTESNALMSDMVRRVDNSGWLGDVSLPSIVSGPTTPIKLYQFSMNFIVLAEEGD